MRFSPLGCKGMAYAQIPISTFGKMLFIIGKTVFRNRENGFCNRENASCCPLIIASEEIEAFVWHSHW